MSGALSRETRLLLMTLVVSLTALGGMDVLRLDAVAHLYERQSHPCM